MKKIAPAGLAGMLLASASVGAMSISGQVDKGYTNIGVGFGTESAGLALNGNWTHNNDDGGAASVGLGLNLPFGPLMATIGGKGVYANPNDDDKGYAAAVDGGLQWQIDDSFRLFGEYYYSPDSFSGGIRNYEEVNTGVRCTIVRPVSTETGYRHLSLAGKNGNRDNVIVDDPYVEVNASFWCLPARRSVALFSFLLHPVSLCVIVIR